MSGVDGSTLAPYTHCCFRLWIQAKSVFLVSDRTLATGVFISDAFQVALPLFCCIAGYLQM